MQLDLQKYMSLDKISKMVIVHRDYLKNGYLYAVKLDLHIHRTFGRKLMAIVAHKTNIQVALAAKRHYSYLELLDADSSGEEDDLMCRGK